MFSPIMFIYMLFNFCVWLKLEYLFLVSPNEDSAVVNNKLSEKDKVALQV